MRAHLLKSAVVSTALTGAAMFVAPASEALEIHAMRSPPLAAESFPDARAERRSGSDCRAFGLLNPDIEIESGFARPRSAVLVDVEADAPIAALATPAGFFMDSSQSADMFHGTGAGTLAGPPRQNDTPSRICIAAPPLGAA